MIDKIIEIKLQTLELNKEVDLDVVATELWKRLVDVLKKHAKGNNTNELIISYYELCNDDTRIVDNNIWLCFANPGGMCELSSALSYHLTELILSTHQEDINAFFNSAGWTLKEDFEKTKTLKNRQEIYFFSNKTILFGVFGKELEQENLILDNGYEPEFSKLNAEKISKALRQGKCECFLCEKISENKFKPSKIKPNTIKSDVCVATNMKKALKFPDYVKELDFYEIYIDPQEFGKEILQLKNLKRLILSYNSMDYFPEEICQLQSLELFKSHLNRVKKLPENISNLKQLKRLHLSNTFIQSLPSSFFSLEQLEQLELESCDFNEIPLELLHLKSIHHLSFQNNESLGKTVVKFPFDKLEKLNFLNLFYTGLDAFPIYLVKNKELKHLDLARNNIKEIPKEISNCQNLRSLKLSDNQLSKIPDTLFDLSLLEYLSIEENPINFISERIAELSNLKSLYLRYTELTELPESIGQLSQLETLALPDSITKLPASLKNCKELKDVYVSGNSENIKKQLISIGLNPELVG